MAEVDVHGDPGPTVAEAVRIRALIMNIQAVLRKTNIAHLVAGPIEHIHRSLDRIEDEGRQYVEQRRPGRQGYTNPELIALLRKDEGSRSGDRKSHYHNDSDGDSSGTGKTNTQAVQRVE
jgi:hypothetical protein